MGKVESTNRGFMVGPAASPAEKVWPTGSTLADLTNEDPRVSLVRAANIDADDWTTLESIDLGKISSEKSVPSLSGTNHHMPEALEIRIFELGGPNSGGPKFQIAENFGATPVGIALAGDKEILWSPARDGQYKRELGMAGTIGGKPIVAPAGRVKNKEGEPAFDNGVNGGRILSFNEELLGRDGRIPKDSKGVMAHGGLFTSTQWGLDRKNIKIKGENGKDGIQVTYKLQLHRDLVGRELLTSGAKGAIAVTYTCTPVLESGKRGVKFDTDINIRASSQDGNINIGSLALHDFYKTKANAKLTTNAPRELATGEEGPSFPTGDIRNVSDKHDFSQGKFVHQGDLAKNLEVVLTGYEDTPEKIPTATLDNGDGVIITKQSAGIVNGTVGFDGLLVCNAGGEQNLMLEDIARYPNIFNKPCLDQNANMKPIIANKRNPFRAYSSIVALPSV